MSSKRFKSIIVAVSDLERKPQLALQKATKIALKTQARLTLLHTFALPYPVVTNAKNNIDVIRATQRRHEMQLWRLARTARARGVAVDCVVVWDFPPHEAIVRYVLQHKADLLIAESHRRNRLSRWLLANTDWELLRACPCPVWFVKSSQFPTRQTVLAAVDPMHAHAKPAELEDAILTAAQSIEQQLDAVVHVVHAYQTPMIWAPGPMQEPIPVPVAEHDAKQYQTTVRTRVTHLVRRYRLKPNQCQVHMGEPGEVIEQWVKKLKANVLVMGAVARHGLARVFIGSTAERVIDHVSCDILIVKGKHFKSPITRQRATQHKVGQLKRKK